MELSLHSTDGDQGFPGNLETTVRFTLHADTLTMSIRAVSDADTVCSITNHVYWNLAGHGSGTVDGHILTVPAARYLETDADTIPTGRLLPVSGTPRDLRAPVPLKGRELDHTLLLPEQTGLQTAGRLYEPVRGRWRTVSTDLPAVQVYTGDHLPLHLPGKGGAGYGPRSGVCLEAQFCPDSPNHEHSPSTLLRAGETMNRTICWTFGIDMEEHI